MQKKESINSIVEGCFPDTPSRLMYASMPLQIPQNVQVILRDHHLYPRRYILHAINPHFTDNPRDITIVHNPTYPYNTQLEANKTNRTGWPILQQEPNFRWIFEAQRAIITKDGRVYVDTERFEQDRRLYLSSIPTILKECGQIFRGEKTETQFNETPSRAF